MKITTNLAQGRNPLGFPSFLLAERRFIDFVIDLNS